MTSLTELVPVRAGRSARVGIRPGAVLAIVLTGQLMAVLDATIVNVAVPSMHADLHAGVDPAALFQPGVPGDTDPGQLREFLAAQASGAAAATGRQAHVLWGDALPPAAQERGQLGPAGAVAGHRHGPHIPILASRTRPCQVVLVPG